MTTKLKIKAFIGVAGSGKDFYANKCDERLAFADGVRADVWKILGWAPKNPAEYEEFKVTKFNLPGGGECFGRTFLTNYGTDIRRAESVDYWADRLIDTLQTRLTDDITIGISDCRFKNEVDALIDFAYEYGADVTFVHANFKSDRYDTSIEHESEHFAQKFAENTFTDEEFTELMYSIHTGTI